APPAVRERLVRGGWRLVDPREVTRDPWTYQRFLRGSRAEFCVAKHAYVSTRSGWFSDRSAGYLASGRPVIVQDTGFSDFLPCGLGLVAWRKPAEAIAVMECVNADYVAHCSAARGVVKGFFDAAKMLTDLLEQ